MSDVFDRATDLEQWQREQALSKALDQPASTVTSLGCHECGEPIPEARRKAAPHCTRCIDCQKDFEHARK
ncbi:TraR/DksA family transcriptional regulator [Chitinibacter sp. S2-10]|uniref:TraR/DksA family transcriptional regulator n=1 Tax=Chitinibacter sp. S2-10 TaxID=3373597 RepID=UPI003977D441